MRKSTLVALNSLLNATYAINSDSLVCSYNGQPCGFEHEDITPSFHIDNIENKS